MKLVLRVLNIVIMALAVTASVFLFASPAFTFNSRICLNIDSFSQFVPENDFSRDLNFVDLLGTDEIQVRLKFNLSAGGVSKIMNGDREIINNEFVSSNVEEIVDILDEPVKLITELTIRNFLFTVIKDQITSEVDKARHQAIDSGLTVTSTTQEIMDEVGIDDAYFNDFTYAMYSAADIEGATTDSVGDVLFEQIDTALAKAEESGMVDTSSFSEETKTSINSYFVSVMHDMNLIEADGTTLKPISLISYIYMTDFIKDQLVGKVTTAELERQTGETIPTYGRRLLSLYVLSMMPDLVYQIIGYVSLGLFIGLFVFAAVWGLLFVITLLKTLTKKPWTFFGFWFWPIGALQLLLGLGLTVFGKFLLPSFNILSMVPVELPIKSIVIAPRTYALAPSLIFIATAAVAVVYAICAKIAKSQYRDQQASAED